MASEIRSQQDQFTIDLENTLAKERLASEQGLSDELSTDMSKRVEALRASWRYRYLSMEKLAREEYAQVC
jgi:hypothetical protein